MDAIQINRNNIVQTITDLEPYLLKIDDGRLLAAFDYRINHKFNEGQHLVLRRYVYGEGDSVDIISRNVEILEKGKYSVSGKEYDAIYTTLPNERELRLPSISANKLKIKPNSGSCTSNYDAYFDDVHRYLMVKIGDSFIVNDWLYYYDTDGQRYFIVEFDRNHNIFAQDVYTINTALGGDYSIEVRKNDGKKIGEIGGVAITFTGASYCVGSADTLTDSIVETCGKFDGEGYAYNITERRYTYAPQSFSRRRIIFSAATSTEKSGAFFDVAMYLLTNGDVFVPKYTPYFYYNEDNVCFLWKDAWWAAFERKNGGRSYKELYINSGHSKSILGFESDYWSVPSIALSMDDSTLGAEDTQGNDYVDKIIDSFIPDVIDMERIKYKPVYRINEGGFFPITSITFDFHFRKRKEKENSLETYPVYDDGWYIDANSGATEWWNGFDYSGSTFDAEDFYEFITSSGSTSDLLGYLNFDDDDVYYRKSKVSLSFIRLSFYTSTDPLTQKLLYYSTIFLDSTALFGKFIKQSEYKYTENNNDTTPVVFYDYNGLSARLDTEICVKNEFNNMMSSEGFNLYLFADDVEANNERTIYMKVEFNHAGTGKVIPMVKWPFDDEVAMYRKITAQTFLKDLYIPITIGHINNEFVYWFEEFPNESTADTAGGGYRLILFEPKLDEEKDI